MNNITNVLQKSSFSTKFIHPNQFNFLSEIIIPYWLLQIPKSELSETAKKVYGRLLRWGHNSEIVHRSVNQLAREVKRSSRTIERALKELRTVGLIITYLVKHGGVNHYKFLAHEWMEEEKNRPDFKLSSLPDKTPIRYSKPSMNKGISPPVIIGDPKYINNFINKNIHVDTIRRPVDKYKFVDKDPPRSSVNRQPFFISKKEPEKTAEQKAKFEAERKKCRDGIEKIKLEWGLLKNTCVERNLDTNFKRSTVGYTSSAGSG